MRDGNILSIVCPDLTKEWHPTKNGILKPSDVTCGMHKSVWWICSKGHEWEAMIYSRVGGNGCPVCSNQKVLAGYNDLLTTNPSVAKDWNYKKNTVSPSQVTMWSKQVVWWTCPVCHYDYEKSVSKRTVGENCPYCSGKKVMTGFNDLKTWCEKNQRFDLINEFDEKKNGFTMSEITSGNGRQVWWLCSKGHSYQATLHHRLKMGTGCGICSHKVFRKGENDLLTTNPEIAKEWDYQKNKVGPSDVMAGCNNRKYWFVCPKGHSYRSAPLNRKRGTNCPICAMEKHTSFPEKAIFYYISSIFPNAIENYHDKALGRKELDIYIPDYKVGIEYDGRAWHKHPKRDIDKDDLCEKNGIVLFRIREQGCAEYESSSIKRYINSYSAQELNEAIHFVLTELKKRFGNVCDVSVDIERDQASIQVLIIHSEKEKSIAYYCPVINDYWDDKENGIIKPEQISHGSDKIVHLRCEKGHKWAIRAVEFKSRPWCPYCDGHMMKTGVNDLFTTNPELIHLWSKNNKLDPRKIKAGCNSKALWVCDTCGYEFERSVCGMMKTQKCPYCTNRRVKKGFNDLSTTNPDLLPFWNYEKNNGKKPEDYTRASQTTVWWRCPECNDEWFLDIHKMVARKTPCKHCWKRKSTN